MSDLAALVAPAAVRFADVDPTGRLEAYLADVDGERPQLWLRRDGGAPVRLTAHDDAVAFAAFRPGGDTSPALVYGVDRAGDENQELRWHDLASGAARPLTAAPDARHAFGAFRPDGGALAWTTNAANGVDMDVVLHDLGDGATRRVLRGHGLRRVEAWSPCGRFLAIVGEHAALSEELHLLDLATGGLRPLLGAGGATVVRAVRFTPDGDLILVTDAGRELAGVARLAAADGRLSRLLAGAHEADRLALAKDARRLAVTWNVEGRTTLELHDLVAAGPPRRFALDGVAGAPKWRPTGDAVLATVETPTTPARPWCFHADTGEAAALDGWAVPGEQGAAPTRVQVASFDGRALPAFLYRPPAPSRGPAPAVMCVHGGPESQWRPGYHGEVAALLAAGWTVLAPNIRGSTGYGRTFAGLDDRERRGDAFADIAAHGRWLAAHEEVDAARLALMGQSYGGFTTLAGLARDPGRWCGGVDLYGMADLATFLAETAPYRRAHRAAEYGAPGADDPLLAELSPLARAHEVAAPVFIAHGLADPRVRPAESRRMAAALRTHGKTVEHLEIADEGHGFTARSTRTAVYTRALDFLRRCAAY